jgi:hypothetical protein
MPISVIPGVKYFARKLPFVISRQYTDIAFLHPFYKDDYIGLLSNKLSI